MSSFRIDEELEFPFKKNEDYLKSVIIHNLEKSKDYSRVKEHYSSLITIADRLFLSAGGTTEFGDLQRRVKESFQVLSDKIQTVSGANDWGSDFITNCIEPWLKLMYQKVDPVGFSNQKKSFKFTLFSVLINIGIINKSELQSKSIHSIQDETKKHIYITHRKRNEGIHWAPQNNNSSNLAVSVIVTFFSAIYKHRDILRKNLSGLVTSQFSHNSPIDLIKLYNNEFMDHINKFQGHKDYLNRIVSKIIEQIPDEGRYYFIKDLEGTGKTAFTCKIAQRIAHHKNISGSDSIIVRKYAPWVPGIILHLGKQSKDPYQIVCSIVAQANTMLINKVSFSRSLLEDGYSSQLNRNIQDGYFRSSDLYDDGIQKFSETKEVTKELQFLVYESLNNLVEERGEAFLVIDSLDEITSDATELFFLPPLLPRGAVCLLTTRPEKLICNFLVSQLRAIDLGYERISFEDIKLITNIFDDDWNRNLYKVTNGIPLHVWYYKNKLIEFQGDYKQLDFAQGPMEIFENSVIKWRFNPENNCDDLLWRLLHFLAVFENVGSIKIELCQSYLKYCGYEVSNYELQKLLNIVSSQIYGLKEGSIKLAVKAFGDYVLDKVLGVIDLNNLLKKIVMWISEDEYISLDTIEGFLLYWTDPVKVYENKHRRTANELINIMIKKEKSIELRTIFASMYAKISNKDKLPALCEIIIRRCSKSGFAWAQFFLGMELIQGKKIEKNISEGEKWLRKATENNDSNAMFFLGMLYSEGHYLERNIEEGEKWLRMAIKEGDLNAVKFLGMNLILGGKFTKNVVEGKGLLMKAIDEGDTLSMVLLGSLLLNGKEIEQDSKKGVELFRKAIELNDSDAMFILGLRLIDGEGVDVDIDEGEELLIHSIRQDNKIAMYHYGSRLIDGHGFDKDIKEGEKWLHKAAEEGYPKAAYELGLRLIRGENIKKDLYKGVEYIKKAANYGITEAMALLGELLIDGYGIEKNARRGVKWLQKAIDNNDYDSITSLSNRLFDGDGVPKNTKRAIKLIKQAVEEENINALISFGNRLIDGKEIDREVKRGVDLLERAIELGSVDAMVLFGNRLIDGQGLNQDILKGVKLLQNAVDNNSEKAMVYLGNRYLLGHGVDKDTLKGKKLLDTAIRNGSSEAMKVLGIYLLGCEEPEQDLERGKKLLLESAEMGNIDARYNLGFRLIEGDGVEKNFDDGIAWVRMAVEEGHMEAITFLGITLLEESKNEKDIEEGEMLLRRAIENNNAYAMLSLGLILMSGIGLRKDIVEGEKLLRSAVALDDVDAMYELGCFLIRNTEKQKKELEGEMLLRSAAEKRQVDSMFELGNQLIEGVLINRDLTEGEYWLREAVNYGSDRAIYSLGIYILDEIIKEKEKDEAIKLLELACINGNEFAKIRLLLFPFEVGQIEPNEINNNKLFKEIDQFEDNIEEYGYELYKIAINKKMKKNIQELYFKVICCLFLNEFNKFDNHHVSGNSLAYMLRRNEINENSIYNIEDLLEPGIKIEFSFSIVNEALRRACGFQCEINWDKADDLIRSLKKNCKDVEEILDWWYSLIRINDPEGHLVIGWLSRHSLIKDPDNLSVADRLKLAQAGTYNIPEWMYKKAK